MTPEEMLDAINEPEAPTPEPPIAAVQEERRRTVEWIMHAVANRLARAGETSVARAAQLKMGMHRN